MVKQFGPPSTGGNREMFITGNDDISSRRRCDLLPHVREDIFLVPAILTAKISIGVQARVGSLLIKRQ